MKESPLIVPIQLGSDEPKTVTPICCIQTNRSEITFYPGVNDDVLKKVLTDMRCGIDSLAKIITDKYNLDLFDDALFLFCG